MNARPRNQVENSEATNGPAVGSVGQAFATHDNANVPYEWSPIKVGQVCQIEGGCPFESQFFSEKDGIPLIRIRDVHSGQTETKYSGAYDEKYLVRNGDLLIGMDGEFRVRKWRGGLGLLNQRVCRLVPDEEKIDKEFLRFAISTPLKRIEDFTSYTTVKHISANQIRSIELPYPPLSGQQKIAFVLGLVQRAIEQQERLIAVTDELTKALMHHLFTRGLRAEPQKETEIGLIPQSWDVRSIEELQLDIGDGNYSTKYPRQEEFRPSGVPFLRANNIVKGRLIWSDMRYISPDLHEELKKGHTKKGDVCLVTRGNIGEVAFVTDEFVDANMNAQLVRLNGEGRVDGKFLYFAFQYPNTQAQIKSLKTGTALQQLPIGKLKFVKIPIPSLQVQQEIGGMLWVVNEKRGLAERRRRALDNLFRTLLYQLMTAKIRVDDLDLSELESSMAA
jgi:type I restriction enzyme S subunit